MSVDCGVLYPNQSYSSLVILPPVVRLDLHPLDVEHVVLLVVVAPLHRLPPLLQLVLLMVELCAEVCWGVLAHPVFL